jgi:hypothetical protein
MVLANAATEPSIPPIVEDPTDNSGARRELGTRVPEVGTRVPELGTRGVWGGARNKGRHLSSLPAIGVPKVPREARSQGCRRHREATRSALDGETRHLKMRAAPNPYTRAEAVSRPVDAPTRHKVTDSQITATEPSTKPADTTASGNTARSAVGTNPTT